jgi:hypothetical protein
LGFERHALSLFGKERGVKGDNLLFCAATIVS